MACGFHSGSSPNLSSPAFHRKWLAPVSVKKICQKTSVKKVPTKNEIWCPETPKMDPNWSQKLRNSGPEPDLEKTSDKKPQNINSVHYLLCFKHIQVLPKASLFVTVLAPKLVPEPLRKGSPKKLSKSSPLLTKKIRKRIPEGPQSCLKIHQILTPFRPWLGTRNIKSGILLPLWDGPPPFFHKIERICQKNAIKKFIEKTPSTKWSRTSKWSPGDSQNGAKMEPKPLKNEVRIRSWKAIRKKTQNINSVHYLLCFKHIQAHQKT